MEIVTLFIHLTILYYDVVHLISSSTLLFHFIICLFSNFQKAIKAKAIILNQKEDVSKFNQFRAEDLPEMENLEVLILYHTNFSGRQISLSDSLCYLLWNGYPFISLPSNFQPYRLVELHMPESSIEQLWTDTQVFVILHFSSFLPFRILDTSSVEPPEG